LAAKGIIPTREKDQFGIGYYYLKFSGDIPQSLRRRLSFDHEQGAELFYNVGVFPWFHVTPDLQFISPSRKTLGTLLNSGKSIQTGVVPALRVKIDF
jgi:porin